ncbi:MAG: CinA family protein [Bacteroidetes bacterium]|nr:CinA family protein [Bacteroidota bacterium]
MTKANLLIKSLKKVGLTVAFAESVTCGMAVEKLSTCIGLSEVLAGGIVCYTPEVKCDLLNGSKTLINKYTCESMQVTTALAKNLPKLIKADIHVAITGLASAGGTETKDKPVGTIFFCIKYKNKLFKERKLFRGTPLEIREKANLFIYEFIQKTAAKN